MSYFKNKEALAAKAREHTDYVARKFFKSIRNSITNSYIYNPGSVFAESTEKMKRAKPEVAFSNTDSVSAIFDESNKKDHGRIAVLNFASYKNPGGRFYDGSSAQEEALCHESTLYNILRELQFYYDWNRKNVNKGMYLNRAIYSKDVLFMRNENTVECDVLTCACPNKIPCVRYHSFTDEENSETLKERIHFIRQICEENSVDTLILGAFGCGVFMQDPKEVAEVFKTEFAKTSIKKIVYAVSGSNKNTVVFREMFGNEKEGN